MSNLPLSHLTIIDIGNSLAGAFATKLLADFGATVVVIESSTGSPIRKLMPDELRLKWWHAIGKNKQSVLINSMSPQSDAILLRIMEDADIIFTDIGPLGWSNCPWLGKLDQLNHQPLVVDLYATGVDLPHLWQGTSSAVFTTAITGMMHLTGWENGPPVSAEVPIAEYLAGMMAAMGAIAETNYTKIHQTQPRNISMAMHEAVLRMIEWQLPIASLQGAPVSRNGNNFPMNAGISNMPKTKDGQYIAISAANQDVALRLLRLIGGQSLAEDPKYATPANRAENMDEIYDLLNEWVSTKTQAEILELAQQADVVVGPIYNTKNVLEDQAIRERGYIQARQTVDGQDFCEVTCIPSLQKKGLKIEVAPILGANTKEFLTQLGITEMQYQELVSQGVIGQAA